MTKEFIPYEQALELKELGFDEPCCTSYDYDGILQSIWNVDWDDIEYEIEFSNTNGVLWNRNSTNKLNYISAPLYQQAFRFFREKYNILGTIYSNASGYLYEYHDAVGGTHRGWSEYEGPNDSGVWDTYEEAEHACLLKLIELAKQK